MFNNKVPDYDDLVTNVINSIKIIPSISTEIIKVETINEINRIFSELNFNLFKELQLKTDINTINIFPLFFVPYPKYIIHNTDYIIPIAIEI